MKNKLAVAFCVHHKPWLMMSTWITMLIQDYKDIDFYIIYQMGDGSCANKQSYREYFALAQECGENVQLSPYDERVRGICRLNNINVYEMEFENDHGLDSGAWYKFIKTGKWKSYDYVFFVQEGTLLTRDNVISATLEFAKKNNVHFLASGHEKRRLPKDLFRQYHSRDKSSTKMDAFHDQKMMETFDVFSRDEGFKKIFDQWGSDFTVCTQNHVPDIFDPLYTKIKRLIKSVIYSKGSVKNIYRSFVGESVYVDCVRYKVDQVVNYEESGGIKFHTANEIEWFGCACNHMLSHQFLERFTEKLEKYNMYDLLDLPFSGSALEVIWGFLPGWLGYDKWFFDGFHRVRKNFVNFKREDDPAGMASYLNRYYRGELKVINDGDFIRIKKMAQKYFPVKNQLNQYYFMGNEEC